MSGLTEKQKRFIDEYLVDLNATQAAKRSGYSAHTAMEQGYQLLQNTSVLGHLRVKQEALAKRTELTQDWVISRLKEVAERCMSAEPVLDHDGEPTGEYIFQANGANRSLELLGKHIGMFNDKLKITIETPSARVYPLGLENEQHRLPAASETVDSVH